MVIFSVNQKFHFRILRNRAAVLITFGGSLFGIYSYHQSSQWSQAKILLKAETKVEQHEEKSMSRREKRFHDFASTEYNQQVVMTPLDFIESLVENEPRCKYIFTSKYLYHSYLHFLCVSLKKLDLWFY